MFDPDRPDWIFGELSHIGVISEDIQKTMADYGQLGYTFALREGEATLRRPGLGPQSPFVARSAWSLQGPPHIEIGDVAGLGDKPDLWPSLGHDHVDHVGYWVNDLAAVSAALEARGFPLEATPAGDDTRPLGFCYHRTPNGARIELEDGPMRKKMLHEQLERVRRGETGVLAYRPFVPDGG